ncbi:MAG: hypothetical protein ACFB15_09075 [Cyclobacteriaceae bacterium]
MKLLLDENLPKKLKSDFPDHEIYIVSDKKWNSKKNGELLQLMLAEGFDVLFTFDKNLQYQQNFKKYPISIVILNAEDNAYITLKKLIPQIKELLNQELPTGPIEVRIRP